MKKNNLGSNFFENIDLHNTNFQKKNIPSFNISEKLSGIFWFYPLLVILFFILFVRLFRLQVVEGVYHRERAEQNRLQEKIILPLRGIIKDRHGEVLVRNKPLFKKITGPAGEFKYISQEDAIREEIKGDSKIKIETVSGRFYPHSWELAHVLGYLGEVDQEEFIQKKQECLENKEKNICQEYSLGEYVGKSGLEKIYEDYLRGKAGREMVENDSRGKFIKTLAKIDPINGMDLYTSLDLGMQVTAYEALQKTIENERSTAGKRIRGSVIVSIPETGEIISLVSLPSFDPNLFQGLWELHPKTNQILNILEDTEKPMFNRAIGGVYPPGSTFKIITATAALETGKLTKDTLIEDVGEITIGPYKYPNWAYLKSGTKDGLLNIIGALRRSNDIFFYKTGEMVGLGQIDAWSIKFGLGQRLGIDLPEEAAGLVPTDVWKRDVIGEKWYLGDTYHLAIGQGYLLVTPLQVNNLTNVIANGGKLCEPQIMKTPNFKKASDDDTCREVGIKKETIELIKQGMEEACKPGGTGWPLFNFEVGDPKSKNPKKINIACKTGTAEYGEKMANGYAKTHAWFTSYAPAEKPEISVTVLVEDGGEGSDVAAPIAKVLFEEWFKR